MNLAGKIKEVRMKSGLSQAKFADSLGVTQSRIARYELGKGAPDEALIDKICSVYKTARAFFEEDGADKKEAAAPVKEAAAASAKPGKTEKKSQKAGSVKKSAPSKKTVSSEKTVKAEADKDKALKKTMSRKKAGAPAEKKPAGKASAAAIVIQSQEGGEIGLQELLKRIARAAGNVESIYVKSGEGRAYWVKGDDAGWIDLW